MTPAGYTFLAASWAVIIGLNLFCFWRLTRAEQSRQAELRARSARDRQRPEDQND